MKCVAVGDMFLDEEAFSKVLKPSGLIFFLSRVFMEKGSGSYIDQNTDTQY